MGASAGARMNVLRAVFKQGRRIARTMSRRGLRTFALLMIALLFAGCADAPTDDEAEDEGDPRTNPTTGTTRSTGSGATPPAGSDATDDPARWYAFAFDREVEAKSGGSGRIQSYSYTSTTEEGGKETTVDVDVTVEGVSTQTIRTQKMDMAAMQAGNMEPNIISSQLEVAKLRHVMTVVTDETGEHQAGESTVVTVYVPTGNLPQSSTFLWYFAKMSWEGAGSEVGTWEYYVSPEMQAQQQNGTGFFLPFEEGGSSTDWWGFELMTSTYGLSWFAPYVTGAQGFQEGSFSYGGYSQDVRKDTFTIGSYTFDGWSVELSGVSGQSSSGWMMKASEDLPLPIAYRFGTTGESSSLMSYELTDVKLG